MDDFDQLASAGLTIVVSAIMLVTSLLFIDARATKQPLSAPKTPTAALSTSPGPDAADFDLAGEVDEYSSRSENKAQHAAFIQATGSTCQGRRCAQAQDSSR